MAVTTHPETAPEQNSAATHLAARMDCILFSAIDAGASSDYPFQ